MIAKRWAYYNDIDPNVCEWVEQLIKMGQIAPGVVDNRSIVDVDSVELKSFTQIHLFCGIAVWSYSLRQAGWADDREIVTGSCPCQSFSAAGKQRGFDDERHLWPHMFRIVAELRPSICIGEQVASAGALAWWDLVASDLESADYAATAIDLSGASIGAPHIRQRLFWVGHSNSQRLEKQWVRKPNESGHISTQLSGDVNIMAHSPREQPKSGIAPSSSEGDGSPRWDSTTEGSSSPSTFWDDCDWIHCRDGKYRATKSGISPLAPRSTAGMGHSSDPSVESIENTQEARIMRLKGYGNAIVAPLAVEFISAYLDCES